MYFVSVFVFCCCFIYITTLYYYELMAIYNLEFEYTSNSPALLSLRYFVYDSQ